MSRTSFYSVGVIKEKKIFTSVLASVFFPLVHGCYICTSCSNNLNSRLMNCVNNTQRFGVECCFPEWIWISLRLVWHLNFRYLKIYLGSTWWYIGCQLGKWSRREVFDFRSRLLIYLVETNVSVMSTNSNLSTTITSYLDHDLINSIQWWRC